MSLRTAALSAAAVVLALAAPALAAPPEGKGKPDHAGKPDRDDRHGGKPDKGDHPQARGASTPGLDDVVTATVLGEIERRLIGDYFRATPTAALPPGLARQNKLPPGIARQIQRGQRLPDDIVLVPLPDDLLHRLPPYRGAQPVVVGGDVVLIQEGTRLILDILENVL